jgi:acyl-CoA thioester hydrolase
MKSSAIRERVRWADVDAAGIIYFGAYARFIDIAESEFMRALGYTFATLESLGITLPRVHVEFDFFKPAKLDDEMTLETRVAGVGVHSVRYKFAISRESDDALLAEATVVVACVERTTLKSCPLPAELARTLRERIEPAVPAPMA